jgi:rod shape determining protein RodA
MRQNQQSIPVTNNLDWITFGIYLLFVFFGWIAIYAAVYDSSHQSIFDIKMSYGKQLIWIGASLLAGLIILLLDNNFFSVFAYAIYGLVLAANIAVIFLSKDVSGSHGWFELGSFKLQPAEFAKFATALALAKYLSGYGIKFKDFNTKVISIAIILLPMVVILAQNDTGSALVFLSFVLVLYREGLPGFLLLLGFIVSLLFVLTLLVKPLTLIIVMFGICVFLYIFIIRAKQLVILMVGGLIIASAFVFSVDYLYNNLMQPHQKTRIDVLLGKELDLKGAGYNVHQSKIAIGSGGFWGKGFLEGTQTKFNFVPEQSTDFIFCTIGEEYGWVGCFVLISLFIILLSRILVIAERQKNKFNRVYAYCVASILFFHFTINIGMTIGLLPVIGIPLPFFSYGGSSLISFSTLLFILLKLDANRVHEVGGSL